MECEDRNCIYYDIVCPVMRCYGEDSCLEIREEKDSTEKQEIKTDE